jgi:hypothetical protein
LMNLLACLAALELGPIKKSELRCSYGPSSFKLSGIADMVGLTAGSTRSRLTRFSTTRLGLLAACKLGLKSNIC